MVIFASIFIHRKVNYEQKMQTMDCDVDWNNGSDDGIRV